MRVVRKRGRSGSDIANEQLEEVDMMKYLWGHDQWCKPICMWEVCQSKLVSMTPNGPIGLFWCPVEGREG